MSLDHFQRADERHFAVRRRDRRHKSEAIRRGAAELAQRGSARS
jgi:hypothetical protein